MFNRGLKSLEYTIREKAKQCNNTHFMIVGPMSNILNQKVAECRSSNFNAFGIDWYFEISSDEEKDFLSCFLSAGRNFNGEVECTFKLSLVSQTGGGDISKQPAKQCFKKSVGWSKFVSHENLNKYIVNDKAVFSAEIIDVNPKFSRTPTKGTAELLTLIEVPRNNSKFTWKVTRFSSFDCKSHSSYEFNVGQRRWRLKMYPKGNREDGGDGHLSLYLTATGYVPNSPKAPTVAVYKLRVLDQRRRNHREKNCEYVFPIDPDEDSESHGVSKFLPLNELHNPSRGLLENKEEIYLGVEFLYVSTTEIL